MLRVINASPWTVGRPFARRAAAALLALWMVTVAAACGRTQLDELEPLPTGSKIPTVPTFDESVNSDLDIIFLIDNSGSMREEQDNISRNFPVFISALESLPEGLPNLHIGVLSSDLGAGRFEGMSVEGCLRVGGDGGIFQSMPRGRNGTCTSAPKNGDSYLSVNGSKQNFDGSVSDALACIAQLGIRGCGFEHQLGAIWKALGGDGKMPTQNQGFLRDDALLAIVILTDEDDCSAPDDTDLFDPSQKLISDPLGPLDSYRCNEFGHLCNGVPPPRTMAATNLMNCVSNENGPLMPVGGLVDFFKSLKPSPDDVIVAAITGPTTPYSVDLMRNRSTMEFEPRILPSCMSSNGSAVPAVRIQQFISAFGANGTVESICDGDFSPAMARIGDKIAGRVRHQCLDSPPVDRDPAREGIQANCEVYAETTTSDGVIRAVIKSCDDAPTPCWRIQSDATCPGTGMEVIVDRGSTPAAPHTRIAVLCETCDTAEDPRCAGH